MAGRVPSDAQTLAIIERTVSECLPSGWSLRRRRGRETWTIAAPDGAEATFAVVVGGISLGRRLDAVLAALASADGLPLVAAPFLSLTLRTALAERGVSSADATGNLRIVADRPALFLQRQGATKDPYPTDDTLRSLRGRAAARAVRALVDFVPPFGVRDLSKRATVPLGSLSRTLDLLDRESLVKRGDRGEVLDVDWEGALRRWAQDYAFARSNRTMSYFHAGDLADLTGRLAEVRWQFAVTGAAARQLLLDAGPLPQVSLYVEDIDLAAERLGLQPAAHGANVLLAEPYGSVVFERMTSWGGVALAAPSQVVADVLSSPGVPRGDADELLDWMRADEGHWRTTW